MYHEYATWFHMTYNIEGVCNCQALDIWIGGCQIHIFFSLFETIVVLVFYQRAARSSSSSEGKAGSNQISRSEQVGRSKWFIPNQILYNS